MFSHFTEEQHEMDKMNVYAHIPWIICAMLNSKHCSAHNSSGCLLLLHQTLSFEPPIMSQNFRDNFTGSVTAVPLAVVFLSPQIRHSTNMWERKKTPTNKQRESVNSVIPQQA